MNGQLIMDALGYLDDDLIEATGRQRSKRPSRRWLIPAVTAACLCIVILAAGSPSKTAPEANILVNDYSSISDGFYGAPMPEMPMEAAGNAGIVIFQLLRVTEITETGFAGSVDGEDVKKGEVVMILCDSDVAASLQVGDLVQVEYREKDNLLLTLTVITE